MNRNKKITTVPLVLITFVLLSLVLYIGSLLKEEKTTITTITKTKASSMTYAKTINMEQPEESTPSPTEILLAQNVTPTDSAMGGGNLNFLSPTPEITAEPTSSYLASNITTTPTEIPLASLAVTQGTTTTPKATALPESGKTDYLMTMITLASLIIFLSFLY